MKRLIWFLAITLAAPVLAQRGGDPLAAAGLAPLSAEGRGLQPGRRRRPHRGVRHVGRRHHGRPGRDAGGQRFCRLAVGPTRRTSHLLCQRILFIARFAWIGHSLAAHDHRADLHQALRFDSVGAVNFLQQTDQLGQLLVTQIGCSISFQLGDDAFQFLELLQTCFSQLQVDRSLV
mgnify:CR=1 FL=1